MLLWEPNSRCPSWIDFHLCIGDISAVHFSYLPQIFGWSIGCKLWLNLAAIFFCHFILMLFVIHTFLGVRWLSALLQVLYRFLDYYSKFDWDTKGISLFGPVSLSSLPELVSKWMHSSILHALCCLFAIEIIGHWNALWSADPPDTQDDGFLPREEFLKECAEAFSVPPRNSETNSRVFSRRFLNIVDPLKPSNNLGRSVSKGLFSASGSSNDCRNE